MRERPRTPRRSFLRRPECEADFADQDRASVASAPAEMNLCSVPEKAVAKIRLEQEKAVKARHVSRYAAEENNFVQVQEDPEERGPESEQTKAYAAQIGEM